MKFLSLRVGPFEISGTLGDFYGAGVVVVREHGGTALLLVFICVAVGIEWAPR